MKNKLIVMRNNLGLGHVGDIIITTQERVNKNFPPLAENIINEHIAMMLVNAYNKLRVVNIKYNKDEKMKCYICGESFIITPEKSKLWDTTCIKCGSGMVIMTDNE